MFMVELHLVRVLKIKKFLKIHTLFFLRLNEGFATVFEYLLVDQFYPEWRMQHFMNIFTVQRYAFVTDAKNSTRAMTTDAETPTEISALFDDIAYDKSGTVLRMFNYAVGEALFKEALNLYIATK